MRVPSIRLLDWYETSRRDLPWRRTREPYAIWVSEIMLQQTRVAAALPYYERFMKRFPDVGALARAREETVLALWSGLGYYRRARMLHAAAKIVAREGMPASHDEWRALPGVGDYTAAAIASIAHGEAAPVVDGNVERVVSRYLARDVTKREARDAMAGWIPKDAPGEFNQAVMELGALVCLPREPLCGACPVASDCAGRARPGRFPARPKKRPKKTIHRPVKLAARRNAVFLRRNEPPAKPEGMWDLPPSRGRGRALAEVSHGILDRTYRISVHAGRASGQGRWFEVGQLDRIPLAAAARKCLASVGML